MKFIALKCATTIILNQVPNLGPFSDFDMQQLYHAQDRCKVLFQTSPCLVQFIKMGDREYRAICGKEQR